MPEAPADIRYVAKNMRLDLRLIAGMIAPGSRVLDIGCGDGALLAHLTAEKDADARGIEIDMAEATRAVAAGLAVIQGDADQDLAFYPDGAFDAVVLSRTLQAVERPKLRRVGIDLKDKIRWITPRPKAFERAGFTRSKKVLMEYAEKTGEDHE